MFLSICEGGSARLTDSEEGRGRRRSRDEDGRIEGRESRQGGTRGERAGRPVKRDAAGGQAGRGGDEAKAERERGRSETRKALEGELGARARTDLWQPLAIPFLTKEERGGGGWWSEGLAGERMGGPSKSRAKRADRPKASAGRPTTGDETPHPPATAGRHRHSPAARRRPARPTVGRRGRMGREHRDSHDRSHSSSAAGAARGAHALSSSDAALPLSPVVVSAARRCAALPRTRRRPRDDPSQHKGGTSPPSGPRPTRARLLASIAGCEQRASRPSMLVARPAAGCWLFRTSVPTSPPGCGDFRSAREGREACPPGEPSSSRQTMGRWR